MEVHQKVYSTREYSSTDCKGAIPGRGGHRRASSVVSQRNPCKIGTWNVRSLKKCGKLENLKKEMDRTGVDVLGLSEVRWPDSGDFWSGDYRILYSGCPEGTGGVGFALKKKLGQEIISTWGYNERIIMIKIKAEPRDMVLIQVYMPTSNYTDDQVEEVYEQIEEVLMKVNNDRENLIIMGDWNAVVGEGREEKTVGDFGLGTRNERGGRLVEFCKSHSLIIANTLFKQPKRRRYTWTMPGDGNRYQLDYVLVKERFRNQVKQCKSYPGADVDSDHNLVIMTSRLKLKRKQMHKSRRKWNLAKIKNNIKAQQEFKKTTDETITSERLNGQNIQEKWDSVKKEVVKATEACFGKEEKIPYKPWITEEILDMMEKRRKYKREDMEEYRKYRNMINREARRARDEWMEKKCKDIDENMAKGNTERAYAEIRKQFGGRKRTLNLIKDKDGQVLIEEDEIAERWRAYTVELYKGRKLDDPVLENENQVEEDELGPTILKAEFDKALKELKRQKAPGVDQIPGEVLQALGDEAKTTLFKLINQMYITGEIPEDFERTIMIAIPKKNGAQKCEDHRTLSLLSHSSKILTRIIYHRMERKIEENLPDDQFGFRRNRGTREAILSLRLIIEKTLRVNKPALIAFIDIEKAFDNVDWNIMFKALKRIKIDYRDRRIIYQLYKNQTALIGRKEVEAKISKGVRQGCGLSPLLFNIYIEEAMKDFSDTNQNGLKVNGRCFSTIRFADDIALIAENEHDLQESLRRMNDLLKERCGMRINKKKTKIMKCTRDGDQRADIWMEGEKLIQVKAFSYLGSLITSDGKCGKDVAARIAQAKKAFDKKRSLLTSKTMSLLTKKHFVKSYIWSVGTYASETWTLRKTEKSKLQAFEMWCWRRMMRIPWTDKMKNDDVLRKIGEKRNLLESIGKRRNSMIGHLMRHSDFCTTLMEGMVRERPGRGRPRMEYLDSVMMGRPYCKIKQLALERRFLGDNRAAHQPLG